jgi:hypothetical protein
MQKTLAQKFWYHVGQPEANGCRRWLRRLHHGYGQIVHHGRVIPAHRAAWLLTYQGPIQPKPDFRHSCDNKWCVEPSHITPGSHAANMAEASARRRIPDGAAHFKAKFTESDIRTMRYLIDDGFTHTELAWLYQTTTSNVSYIRQRKTWVYV